jgi:hypothetical protein
MSDQDQLVTAVHGGNIASQLITISARDNRVYIAETNIQRKARAARDE